MPDHSSLFDIFIVPPEYVIVKKLEYWSEGGHDKHLDDIKAMLRIQGDDISREEIVAKLPSETLRNKFNELASV
ncbi:MAG: hypothetical protein GXP32_09685 [Kiritimatiellaeota bacterium]|nr:hypothetical protein [Kiritimatiellota bacterium]